MKIPAPDRELQMRTNLRAVKAPAWEEQYQAIQGRKFAFDFAWPALLLAVEVEGGTWSDGKTGHTSGVGYRNNCRKYNLAQLQGWDVYRFTSDMIDSGEAIDTILAAIARKEAMSHESDKTTQTTTQHADMGSPTPRRDSQSRPSQRARRTMAR